MRIRRQVSSEEEMDIPRRCRICGMAIALENCEIDEEWCYAAKLAAQKLQRSQKLAGSLFIVPR
jgi:hypothetical protein